MEYRHLFVVTPTTYASRLMLDSLFIIPRPNQFFMVCTRPHRNSDWFLTI